MMNISSWISSPFYIIIAIIIIINQAIYFNVVRALEEMPKLFEGDMAMTKSQIIEKYGLEVANEVEEAGLLYMHGSSNENNDNGLRNLGIISKGKNLWKLRDSNNKILIPYEFQSDIQNGIKQYVLDALVHIEDKSGVIKFISRTTQPDWIYFKSQTAGCWAVVGRVGGKQDINLTPTCGFGAAVHEILHALGFTHEQNRSDRDNYVSINYENLKTNYVGNFYKEITYNLGSPYDYSSIMHYGAYDFGLGYWNCSKTEVKKDTVVKIRYQSKDVESNTPFCISVRNGDTNLFDGQVVQFQPCGDKNYINQYWIIEGYGIGYNICRFASDPTYCMTTDYRTANANNKDGAQLIVRKCVEDVFPNQLYPLDTIGWGSVTLIWGNETGYALTRNKTATAPSSYPIVMQEYGYEDFLNQDFAIDFVSKSTGRSAYLNAECKYYLKKVIESYGHPIGQRDGLSAEDINQLQLLYQCPSGPRNITSFCSTECKCKWKQGHCKSDDQCINGFKCMYDGKAINRCYPIISPTANPTLNPSKTPTKNPTQVPTTARPTTKTPTKNPTSPTKSPTKNPTLAPTPPTFKPTRLPTPTAQASALNNSSTLIGVGVAVPLTLVFTGWMGCMMYRRRYHFLKHREEGRAIINEQNQSIVAAQPV